MLFSHAQGAFKEENIWIGNPKIGCPKIKFFKNTGFFFLLWKMDLFVSIMLFCVLIGLLKFTSFKNAGKLSVLCYHKIRLPHPVPKYEYFYSFKKHSGIFLIYKWKKFVKSELFEKYELYLPNHTLIPNWQYFVKINENIEPTILEC